MLVCKNNRGGILRLCEIGLEGDCGESVIDSSRSVRSSTGCVASVTGGVLILVSGHVQIREEALRSSRVISYMSENKQCVARNSRVSERL